MTVEEKIEKLKYRPYMYGALGVASAFLLLKALDSSDKLPHRLVSVAIIAGGALAGYYYGSKSVEYNVNR